MEKLTNEEIYLLMESLDALQSKSVTDGLFGSMLSLAFIQDKDEAKKEMDITMKKAQAEADAIKERLILMKAKLIGMRDRNIVNEASNFLRNG
jgi:hypothetical protein